MISAVFDASVRCSISIFDSVRGPHPPVRYLDRAPGYCYRESGWNRPGSVRCEVADSHRPTVPVAKRPTYPRSEVRSAQLLGVTLGGFDPSQWSLCTSRIRNCVKWSFKISLGPPNPALPRMDRWRTALREERLTLFRFRCGLLPACEVQIPDPSWISR